MNTNHTYMPDALHGQNQREVTYTVSMKNKLHPVISTRSLTIQPSDTLHRSLPCDEGPSVAGWLKDTMRRLQCDEVIMITRTEKTSFALTPSDWV